MYVGLFKFTHVFKCVCKQMHVYKHVFKYINMYLNMYINLYLNMYINMYLNMYINLYLNTRIAIHTSKITYIVMKLTICKIITNTPTVC